MQESKVFLTLGIVVVVTTLIILSPNELNLIDSDYYY